MPMQTTSRILQDGTRNVTMQFTGFCDGTGVETNEPKVVASNLNPTGSVQTVIQRVEYAVNGGVLRILWNSNDPQTFLDLEGFGEFDYSNLGGAKNPASPGPDDFSDASANGDILFTTLGFDIGSNYSVKLGMRKT